MSEAALTVHETISYRLEGPTAVITLNRPERMNAFTGDMTTALKVAMSRAANNPKVRAIIVTGAGRGFCAGADVSNLGTGTPISGDPAVIASLDATFGDGPGPDISERVTGAERFGYFLRTKKPIIAALNGATVGVGLVLALYADVRFAAEEAFVMTAFGQRGMIAEHGIAWLLSRQLGQAGAMDLLLSSRRVPAMEAKALGLVSAVVPQEELLAYALAYAEGIATTMSPRSVAVMKAQVWHANLAPFSDVLSTAVQEMQLAVRHADKDEGVAAFRERRPPNFADLS